MIRNFNCLKETGYTFEALASLTGILGIHKLSDLTNLAICRNYKITAEHKFIKLEFKTNLLEEFSVLLDFNEMTIINIILKSSGRKNDISYLMLKSQILYTTKLKFKSITLFAAKTVDIVNPRIGYKTWGRYGFIPNIAYEEDVRRIIKEYDSSLDYLHELQSNPEGAKYWEKNGIGWMGDFDLRDGSQSQTIFRSVKKYKKSVIPKKQNTKSSLKIEKSNIT